MSTCLFKKVRKQVEYSRLKCRRSFVYASRSRCRRRCRRTSYVVLRLVVPLRKVRFEDGSYGLSFEADLEVFGHGNKVQTFWLHFIKAKNKLFVDGDGTFVTSERDNPSRFTNCLSVSVFQCVFVDLLLCPLFIIRTDMGKP